MRRFVSGVISVLVLVLLGMMLFSGGEARAACAGLCGAFPERTTPIELNKTHIVSDTDAYSTLFFEPHTKYYAYSFTINQRGYLVVDYTADSEYSDVEVYREEDEGFVGRIGAGKFGIGPGSYIIAVSNITSIKPMFTVNDSYETSPNYSFSEPSEIMLGKTYYANIDPANSFDYFKFEMPVAGKVTIDFDTVIPSGPLEDDSLIGIYTFESGNPEIRNNQYMAESDAVNQALQECLNDGKKDEEECYVDYRATYPVWSEYYEGADAVYEKKKFGAGEVDFTSPNITLAKGVYYVKVKMPAYDDYKVIDYSFRLNYTSNSGVVEKAKALNSASSTTITSLKGTVLSGATISRPEMVQRLMNQGYKKADAIAAVDSLGIDFSYNAVRQALALRRNNPKKTFNDITYGELKMVYNFNNFQRRKARTILARWVATGEIK